MGIHSFEKSTDPPAPLGPLRGCHESRDVQLAYYQRREVCFNNRAAMSGRDQ